MAKILKKKVKEQKVEEPVLESPEDIEEPVETEEDIETEVKPERTFSKPIDLDRLSPASYMVKVRQQERLDKIRKGIIDSFVCPEGWKIKGVYSHDETEEAYRNVAVKEQLFWSKIKPQFDYDIIRPANIVSFLVYRISDPDRPMKKKKIKKG